jgi:hypothetical protein
MAPPSSGGLVAIDPVLILSPPAGMEVGYVPIVVRQERKLVAESDRSTSALARR